MEVLLDSNFIISCILKRIDFLEQLSEQGFKVVVPKEVMQELKDLKRENKTSRKERDAIKIAAGMLAVVKRKAAVGRFVDDGLIKRGLERIYIATLDKAIKRKVPNRVVIFSAQNKVGVET